MINSMFRNCWRSSWLDIAPNNTKMRIISNKSKQHFEILTPEVLMIIIKTHIQLSSGADRISEWFGLERDIKETLPTIPWTLPAFGITFV